MIEQLKWLGKEDEVAFEKVKFYGKLAGKAHKYSNHLDGVIRVRAIIFAMSILVFYRVIANYLFHDYFGIEFIIERILFSIILIVAGILYNKMRKVATYLALLPMVLITLPYLSMPGSYLNIIGGQIAVILLILYGLYDNYKMKHLRNQLEEQQSK